MSFDKMILGQNAIYSMNCKETGLNNNVLVCGTSGCGKTMSISEPRLLETVNSNLIVTVTKRRIVDKYTPVLRKRGYQVLDMNFIEPEKSNITYDPLRYIKDEADITFLAKGIVEANPRKAHTTADPYWDNAAISLLAAEIAYTLHTKPEATFTDVLELNSRLKIKEPEYARTGNLVTSLDREFWALEKEAPDSFAINCWSSFKQLPLKTAGCVYGCLNSAIDTIFTPKLKAMIAQKPSVRFEEMAGRKTVLFLSTSAVNPALHYFINMFYAQAFKSFFEYAESLPSKTLSIPMHILCDDFATGGRVPNFPEYISIFREKGISVTLLVQSESQLASMYGADDATTIINNCDTYLYMGGMDLTTGRSISQRTNKPLDEVLSLPVGREFVLRRGQRPLETERYNILDDERYRQISRQEKQLAEQER